MTLPNESAASSDPGAANPSAAHQDSPTSLSAASDSMALSNDVAQAFQGFDPGIHATDGEGKPMLKRGGGYQRKRGRKPGAAQTAGAVNSGNSGTSETPQMSPEQAAVFIVASTTAICHAVFGDEIWIIRDKQEFDGHKNAVKAYLEATGGFKLSPGWALAVSGGTYAIPRLQSEPTKNRMQKIVAWFSAHFSRSK